MRAATSQSYDPGLLARAWARSAALRLAPPPAPPAPTPATPDPPQWTDEQLEAARRDPAAFNAFVLRDEQGQPVVNAEHHLAMQRAMTEHPRLAIRGFAESAKTTTVVGRVLWELGHDPNLRVILLYESTEKAKEVVSLIAQYVSDSEELHAVFPGLRPARRDADPLKKLKGRHVKWSMASFTVERSARLRDPSVRATGYGKPIQGVRADLLIPDDIVTWGTSLSKRARHKLERWFRSGISGRLTNRSRVWFLNTAYHPQDLGRTLVVKDGYTEVRIAARTPTGASVWPAKWSDEQLARRVRDLGGEGSVEVARQVDAQDRDEASTSFRDEWVKKALARGADLELIERWPSDVELPHGAFFCAGVDIAVGEKESSAESAIVVLLCYPFGDPDAGLLPGTYQLAWIEAGRWDGPSLLERIYDVSERFGRCPVFVETVAIQMWALQFKIPNRQPPPLYPFQTGRNKWNPVFGVASLGIDMNSGIVLIPNDDGATKKEVASLLEELKTFSPGEHTGDRHMACLLPGQTVTTARGEVPIEDVQVGDLVLTHKARWRPVTGTSRRPHRGEVVSLRPSGMRALTVTPEHPVWACKPKQVVTRTQSRLIPDGDWSFVPAGEVRAGRKSAGDFVLSPVPSSWPDAVTTRIDLAEYIDQRKESWGGRWYVGEEELNWRNETTMPRWLDVDERAAVLLGLYLAEGWISDGHQASFGLHEDERAIHGFVAEEGNRLFGATTSLDRKSGSRGVTVRINSSVGARMLSSLGRGAHMKSLPAGWMGWPKKLLLAIVRGWFLGDGTMSRQPKGRRVLRGVTVSRPWVTQMGHILRAAAIPFAVLPFKQAGHICGNPVNTRPAWMLTISATDTACMVRDGLAVERSRWGEADLSAIRDRTNSRTMYVAEGAAVRLAEITRSSYEGEVFNLHVEEDESYVAEGIAVHNCWIAREGMRQLADGTGGNVDVRG